MLYERLKKWINALCKKLGLLERQTRVSLLLEVVSTQVTYVVLILIIHKISPHISLAMASGISIVTLLVLTVLWPTMKWIAVQAWNTAYHKSGEAK